jgi:hypothetical protein
MIWSSINLSETGSMPSIFCFSICLAINSGVMSNKPEVAGASVVTGAGVGSVKKLSNGSGSPISCLS